MRAERLARLRVARQYAGIRQAAYARQNGALVVVVDGDEQGLDTEDRKYPWYTICEEHGSLVCHRTLVEAKSHAADPEGWCEFCAEGAPPDPDILARTI